MCLPENREYLYLVLKKPIEELLNHSFESKKKPSKSATTIESFLSD